MINKDIAKFLNTEEAMLSGLRSMTKIKCDEVCKKYSIVLSEEEKKLVRKIVSIREHIDNFANELLYVMEKYPVQEDTKDQMIANTYLLSQFLPMFEKLKNSKDNYSLPSILKELPKLGIETNLSYHNDFDIRINNIRNKFVSHLSIDFDEYNINELIFDSYENYIGHYLEAKVAIIKIIQNLGGTELKGNKLENKLFNKQLHLSEASYDNIYQNLLEII